MWSWNVCVRNGNSLHKEKKRFLHSPFRSGDNHNCIITMESPREDERPKDYRVMYVEVEDAVKNLRQRMKAAVEAKGLGRTYMEHLMAVTKQTMFRYGIEMVPAGERPNHKSGEMKPVWAVIKSEDSLLDQNAILKGLEALDIDERDTNLTPRTIVQSAVAAGLMEPSRKGGDTASLRLVERKPKGLHLTEKAPPELQELLSLLCKSLTVIHKCNAEFEDDLSELKTLAEEAGNGVRGIIARGGRHRTRPFPVTLDGFTRYYVIEHDESTKLGAPKPLPLEDTKKLLRDALRETVRSLTSSGYDVNDGELLCTIMRKHRDVVMTTLKEMFPPPKEVDVDKLIVRDATREELLDLADAEGRIADEDMEEDRGSGRGSSRSRSRSRSYDEDDEDDADSRGSEEEDEDDGDSEFKSPRDGGARHHPRRGPVRDLLQAGSPAESIMSSISARLERQLREKLAQEGKAYRPTSSAASAVQAVEERIERDRVGGGGGGGGGSRNSGRGRGSKQNKRQRVDSKE